VLGTLIAWARAADVAELPELRVSRPTLEEVYLELIRAHEERRAAAAAGAAATGTVAA
jgi:ABC-2 type transport system ATP-binding protein